ncbi:MAG: hypothetical protein CME61_08020, partial [Halobacteriovoraceae bacterium]|nr:hypothetical protein [Halobacteriovoraceae bacterium]
MPVRPSGSPDIRQIGRPRKTVNPIDPAAGFADEGQDGGGCRSNRGHAEAGLFGILSVVMLDVASHGFRVCCDGDPRDTGPAVSDE